MIHSVRAMITCAVVGYVVAGCGQTAESDPYKTLAGSSLTGASHVEAIGKLNKDDTEAVKALERVMWQPAYTVDAREAALNKMVEWDVESAKRSIRQHMPQTNAWEWLKRLSAIIAERNWTDLSPALVSSWARPTLYVNNDLERPEYKALAKMFGQDHVTDEVFRLFVESKKVSEQPLRTRCWDLLHRLGQRQRLMDLLTSAEVPADDAMLLDLRAGAKDFGLVPHNREEILWLRKLREPERREFWDRAAKAVQGLGSEQRESLEFRDLPVIVSASLFDPELLTLSVQDLYQRVDTALHDQPHYVQESNFEGFAGGSRQRLYEFKHVLTWGDLAAMLMAIRAVEIPQVIDHLFDYALRDKEDKSTEYGGVISLDAKDRFEVREFVPAVREHDQKFISSQAMLDAAYTSIFHFHMHVQAFRNERYAGPGYGDVNYADNTRANCLVFTFINENTLNVDYYRHDRVVVDLGVIRKK